MPEKTLALSILVENTVSQEGLRAEHGLSMWLETPEGNVLWDTGQSSLFLQNARKMGVEIEKASCVALSHGHYDHTGGLSAMLTANPHVLVFGHPDMFHPRFSRSRSKDNDIRSIGSPVMKNIVQAKCETLKLSSQPSEILPGVFLTGKIPRITTGENTDENFFLDMECTVRDPILDDQALYFDTSRGLVVLLGCAHSGVINTLDYVANLTGRERIYGVLGGMHLFYASDERLAETSGALNKYEVQMLGPCHCTGERARMLFKALFPGRVVECATGTWFTFAI
ncbi:MAG: MBL fold metallo-hydrolase [Candidatus Latescibacterota bacterium]